MFFRTSLHTFCCRCCKSPTPNLKGGVSAPRARRARAVRYFYSGFTRNGLAFTPSQMPPESKPLGPTPV